MKLKDAPKLEPGHLYLIKRDWDRDEQYLLAYPLYDINGKGKVRGWKRQSPLTTVACFDDDIIIGSVQRIEERKHVRKRIGEKFIKGLHIKRDQVGVKLPEGELCECGNPECDGTGTYRPPEVVWNIGKHKVELGGECENLPCETCEELTCSYTSDIEH